MPMIQDGTLLNLAVIVIALGASLTDLRWRRIPNGLVLAGLALGIGLHLRAGGIRGLGTSLAGAFLGLALFLPFYALGGMGAGDVKLLAALGSLLGPGDLARATVAAALAGGVMALLLALGRGRLRETLRSVGGLLAFWAVSGLRPSRDVNLRNPATLRIPYAVPMAVGVLVVALTGGRL